MFKTTKRDLVFFDLFAVVMDNTCQAADLLEDLFRNHSQVNEKIKAIEELEHRCDKCIHDLIAHLNRSFVTPLDREDIFLITKMLDDIIDSIESTAHRLNLFHIQTVRKDAVELTCLIKSCTLELKDVVLELKHYKTSKILEPKVIEVNRIENQGDETYRASIENLFLNEKDPVEIIKWKEIYEYMEITLDACEDVANAIEGVVSKNV